MATDISFHFNIPERMAYVCRLLRKAWRQQAQVVVLGPSDVLTALNRQLWLFEPLEFVPHARLEPGAVMPPHLKPTPIWLLENTSEAPTHEVLLNLCNDVPSGFERFSRLIEVVTTHEAECASARLRWKHYAQLGYSMTRHEVYA
jgi:DNA polymerase III subunit chi